ncbi:MAG TPA: UDP-N-acetylmuramoyl-tripeptide--D-alanyl-D-alanine ligase [Candidatus Hydrogenedentes bacterium]|nr:UDP-N-acetylmuramoyl-tripeptide--D-alanyl-D-alanine ligase [Candidatus Hydrogenedentota bacterium]HPG68088.1 UDP-N-acetylmuramoyl-tripeptide--D-alanyl-D-alanine ligase [Candidatus Hydrogenedentota bacterium]
MAWQHTLEELARVIGAAPPGVTGSFGSISTDTRAIRTGDVFFALAGERFDGNAFVPEALAAGACAAVTRIAGEPGPRLVVDDPLAALQAFAGYHRRRYSIPLIALTGSCGKTMTKDLTAAVLASKYRVLKTQGNLNNEIGCPLSLLRLDETTERAVIEMGANHGGEIARLCEMARPTESAITLVAPAHLEGFGRIENVAAAKAEIVDALGGSGTFYVNTDDAWCVRIAERHAGRKIRFGRSGDVALRRCAVEDDGMMRLSVSPVGDLRLPVACRAHVTNVLLAIAVGIEHGIERFDTPLAEALRSSSRFRLIAIGPLSVIDDTYNANPASMAAALDALAERRTDGVRIAALGEMRELGDAAPQLHRELGQRAAEAGIDHVFAYGPHADDIVAGARANGIGNARSFEHHDAIAHAVVDAAGSHALLLVKGSRGVTMEKVIEALRRHYAPRET